MAETIERSDWFKPKERRPALGAYIVIKRKGIYWVCTVVNTNPENCHCIPFSGETMETVQMWKVEEYLPVNFMLSVEDRS